MPSTKASVLHVALTFVKVKTFLAGAVLKNISPLLLTTEWRESLWRLNAMKALSMMKKNLGILNIICCKISEAIKISSSVDQLMKTVLLILNNVIIINSFLFMPL